MFDKPLSYHKKALMQADISLNLCKYAQMQGLLRIGPSGPGSPNGLVRPETGGDFAHCTKVLDVGCGTGQVVRQLRQLGWDGAAWQVDASHEMCLFAESNSAKTIVADINDPLDIIGERFHLITASMCLQWVDIPKALANISDLLLPDGKLVYSIPLKGTLHEASASFIQACGHSPIMPFERHPLPINKVLRYPENGDLISILRKINTIGAKPSAEKGFVNGNFVGGSPKLRIREAARIFQERFGGRCEWVIGIGNIGKNDAMEHAKA